MIYTCHRINTIKDLKEIPSNFGIEIDLGTYKNKKHVGNFGKSGSFSFYPTKNMTVSGDGGMITTDDD